MTKFREGDVVDDGGGVERVVIDPAYKCGGTSPHVKITLGMSWTWVRPEALTLLRRPVRVGDVMLLKISGDAHTVTADDLDPKWAEPDWPAWTHQDGTSIEQPKRDPVVSLVDQLGAAGALLPLDTPPPGAQDGMVRAILDRLTGMMRLTGEPMLAKGAIAQARFNGDTSGVPEYRAGDLLQGITGAWFAVLADAEQVDPNYVKGKADDGSYGFFKRTMKHERRRPLRVGDAIVDGWGSHVARSSKVKAIYSDMVKFEDGGEMWLRDTDTAESWCPWRHADGTAIEPPPGAKSEATYATYAGLPMPSAGVKARAPGPMRSEAGQSFAAACRCGYTTVHALGSLDPKEGRCTHSWKWEPWHGAEGAYVFTNPSCGLHVGARALAGARDGATDLLCDESQLARRLFATDPEVKTYVRSRSDHFMQGTQTNWSTDLGRSETVKDPLLGFAKLDGTIERHMQTAWDRGATGKMPEATWYKRAVERAAEMSEMAVIAHGLGARDARIPYPGEPTMTPADWSAVVKRRLEEIGGTGLPEYEVAGRYDPETGKIETTVSQRMGIVVRQVGEKWRRPRARTVSTVDRTSVMVHSVTSGDERGGLPRRKCEDRRTLSKCDGPDE